MRTLTFGISGMHCASCVTRNERALKKVKGVEDASVNFALKQATVSFDEHVAKEHDLHNAVRSIGYDVAPRGAHEMGVAGHNHSAHMHSEVQDAKRKAVLAIALALPVAVKHRPCGRCDWLAVNGNHPCRSMGKAQQRENP